MHAPRRNAEYDFIIVGSGAGGATLAEALARSGRAVLVVERGRREERLGSTGASLRYYDVSRLTQRPLTSREGVILWRTFMAGGSTMVACGNAVRCLQPDLAARGIALEKEFSSVEKDLNVIATPPQLMSSGSEHLQSAAARLGLRFAPMPKCIDAGRCTRCGQCVLGCTTGAKWTARNALQSAQSAGAAVQYETRVETVLATGGRASGVSGVGPRGPEAWRASTVILAAGGLETPRLLQKSGVNAGQGLFADLFVNVYGVSRTQSQLREPAMTLVNLDFHAKEGFLLSPFVNHTRLARLLEAGIAGAALPTKRILGLMVKIGDEQAGSVPMQGPVSKPVTDRDAERLRAGSKVAREILIEAGIDPRSIVTSRAQGAHPGGTAAIGQVVDKDLQTSLPGLYVCDASVLPAPPGLPPIVTIAALARRLAARLTEAHPCTQ